MRKYISRVASIGVAVAFLLLIAGCASNPDTVGQVLSGILQGIGQGLSGL